MASTLTLGILVSLTLVLLAASLVLLQREKKEGFATQSYSVNELDINTCPSFASEIQTAKGSTDCCQGDMIDGKCNGTTFCTKSPAYAGVPSCVDKWRQYFKDKGANFCPPTMLNYYEDVTNASSAKGCSAGPISKDGKMPMDGSAKQCKVYASEEDNLSKTDSCSVEKMRAKIQCPVVNGRSPEASTLLDSFSKKILFKCEYPFELGMPDRCFEKTSLFSYFDKVWPSWRSSGRFEDINAYTCDNYLAQRELARAEANRLQAEQKAREAAEAARKAAEAAKAKAEADAKKRAEEASRLQQQLDEANRKLQQCK
jgi:hypothetical protein